MSKGSFVSGCLLTPNYNNLVGALLWQQEGAVTVRFSLSLLDVRFSGIVAARDYFGPGATVYCQVWTLYLALLSG